MMHALRVVFSISLPYSFVHDARSHSLFVCLFLKSCFQYFFAILLCLCMVHVPTVIGKYLKRVVFSTSLSFFVLRVVLCGKFGSPYLGKAQQPQRAALPIPISVCSIFLCPNDGVAASVWD